MYHELRPLLVALSISIFFVWLYTVAQEADECFSSPYKSVIDRRYNGAGSKRTAGDRKLGFSSIKFINMPKRFDRADAATLQAYLSGLDLEYYPAIEPSDIYDVGTPPSSDLGALKPGEKGCWRAHANIWAEMLRKDIPTVLILESDAAWDINIRPIMAKLSKEFGTFLRKSGSRPLYRDYENDSGKTPHQTHEPIWQDSEDDPWHSSHWDILSLGPCYDEVKQPSAHFVYHDPFEPPSTAVNLSSPTPGPSNGTGQKQPQRERIIYRSGGPVCTTAYAITKRGAAKLLARTAMNLNAPLDMIIHYMVQKDQLVAYGTVPTVMAQWDYVQGIGMEKRGISGVGSDIFRGKGEEDDGGQRQERKPLAAENEHEKLLNNLEDEKEREEEDEMPGWENVMKTNSVWTLKLGQPHASFEEMALQKAWEKIFSTEKNIEV